METGNDTAPVHLRPELLARVREAADEDHRSTDELIGDAVERYLKDRRWSRLASYGEEQARKLGYTEHDLPRLIAEYRQERRKGQ